jgi:hypothetical protein
MHVNPETEGKKVKEAGFDDGISDNMAKGDFQGLT